MRSKKKSLEVNIKQAIDNVERIYGGAVVRFVWTLEPLLGFLETKTRRHCVTHSLQEGEKRRSFRYIYFYDQGFLSNPFCSVSGGFLRLQRKNGTFPAIKHII